MKKATKQRSSPGDRRRQAMMEAAWDLFMQKGYAPVTLDEIIQKAGGSKSSIYEFFGSKEGLFFAIIEQASAKILADIRLPETEGVPVREALRRLGLALGRDILSEQSVGLYRLSVSVSRKFPDIAKLFYDSGPLTVQRAVADFLDREARAGRLRIKDPLRASQIFHVLLLAHIHMAMALNVRKSPSDKELKKIVDEAVDVFLNTFGA